jgi:hypothetical protein
MHWGHDVASLPWRWRDPNQTPSGPQDSFHSPQSNASRSTQKHLNLLLTTLAD